MRHNLPNNLAPTEDIAEHIRRLALAEGFDNIGITDVSPLPATHQQRLRDFVKNGEHGTMEWFANHVEKKCQPQTLMEGAQSIIMLASNYAPQHNPLEWLEQKNQAALACYALGRDYHHHLKKKLRRITRELTDTYGGDYRIFVDTAPLAEKFLAQRAGLGWQGKHSNLVSKEHGSWLLLAAIITSHAIANNAPMENHCGSCQSCIDICPTQAITKPYHVDARKCIAYLTIEHHGAIPLEFRKAIGNRIFGCDDCLAICPWNKFAQTTQDLAYHSREILQNRALSQLIMIDEAEFASYFSQSPLKRLGFHRFIRNILIAIGNSEDETLLKFIQPWRQHDNAMLVETADWAYGELEKI